jgi:putative holliday junction resolvase
MASRRLIGLDYGRVRIGVARTDLLAVQVEPVGFIPRTSDADAAAVVAALARRDDAVGLVLGRPVHADGRPGDNVAWVDAFRAILAALCPLPITQVDERHSTAEAQGRLQSTGDWPAPRGRIDAVAAAILLERYLAGQR